MNKLKDILTGKRPISDVYQYLLGNYRYKMYYSTSYLLRGHIKEQIDKRIGWMDRECYFNGYCKLCGCDTIALQMASKSCDKPCYPTMMTRNQWKGFKRGNIYIDKHGKWVLTSEGRPELLVKSQVYK